MRMGVHKVFWSKPSWSRVLIYFGEWGIHDTLALLFSIPRFLGITSCVFLAADHNCVNNFGVAHQSVLFAIFISQTLAIPTTLFIVLICYLSCHFTCFYLSISLSLTLSLISYHSVKTSTTHHQIAIVCKPYYLGSLSAWLNQFNGTRQTSYLFNSLTTSYLNQIFSSSDFSSTASCSQTYFVDQNDSACIFCQMQQDTGSSFDLIM
jgi:hypothetical protein